MVEQSRWSGDKDGSNQHQQNQRTETHQYAHKESQLIANQFRKGSTTLSDAYHTAHIVVHGAGKDAA